MMIRAKYSQSLNQIYNKNLPSIIWAYCCHDRISDKEAQYLWEADLKRDEKEAKDGSH